MQIAYWKNKHINTFDRKIYLELLKYNPFVIIEFFAFLNKEQLSCYTNEVLETLDKFLSFQISDFNKNKCIYIQRLISNFDNIFYSNDYAEKCIQLFTYDYLSENSLSIRKYYFYNPQKLIEEINYNKNEKRNYFYFKYSYKLPKEAYQNFDSYENFFNVLLSNIISNDPDATKLIVGQILGRSITGEDGLFPHEFTREILENYDSDTINRGFLVGYINSIGVRTITDGSDQFAISNKFYEAAQKLEIDYPVTAKLLKQISKDHKSDGLRENLYSELGTMNF